MIKRSQQRKRDIEIVRTFVAFGPTGIRLGDGTSLRNSDGDAALNRLLEDGQPWAEEVTALQEHALLAEAARDEWMRRFEELEQAAPKQDGEESEAAKGTGASV